MEPSAEPPRTHPPHYETYEHAKNVKKGSERLDRRSAAGVHGQPKKSGHGGKFTWDGPTSQEDYTQDDSALDEKDPNYVDEEKEDKKPAVDAVGTAKSMPAKPAKGTKEAVAY